jgi:hypothetical protein
LDRDPDWIGIRIRIGVHPKMLGPDPDLEKMNTDPQPWSYPDSNFEVDPDLEWILVSGHMPTKNDWFKLFRIMHHTYCGYLHQS